MCGVILHILCIKHINMIYLLHRNVFLAKCNEYKLSLNFLGNSSTNPLRRYMLHLRHHRVGWGIEEPRCRKELPSATVHAYVHSRTTISSPPESGPAIWLGSFLDNSPLKLSDGQTRITQIFRNIVKRPDLGFT